MAIYDLVLKKPGEETRRFRVGAAGISIGRGNGVDIFLDDPLVSRDHAWVGLADGTLVVEDRGSRNGVEINGARVERGPLDVGDTLTVGESTFEIERRHTNLKDDGSTQISFDEATLLYREMVQEEHSSRLPILYEAAQLLGSVFDQDQLLNQILELIFQALPARRGFILTADGDGEELAVGAQRMLESESSAVPMSHTLIDHVFTTRAAVLTSNAQSDERFQASASIISHDIRAAMCAPLCGRRGCVGAIYVDSGDRSAAFTDGDLQLLMAIGRVVGVAVENATWHRVSLERERLAAIGQATAGLGHCVKNILTGLKAGGEFVDQAIETRNWEWVDRGWPLVRRAADRIENLMMNLLTYSRERTPELGNVSLDDLCGEVVLFMTPAAEKSGVALTFEHGNAGSILADGRALYRVLLNLVTNAVEACEDKEGPRNVHVTTRRGPEGCYVDVTDTGAGISPEIRDKLSQAFVSTKGSRGTGLGLACSYKIVEEHGGAISVESTVGEGTRFSVFIPMRTIAGVPAAALDSASVTRD